MVTNEMLKAIAIVRHLLSDMTAEVVMPATAINRGKWSLVTKAYVQSSAPLAAMTILHMLEASAS